MTTLVVYLIAGLALLISLRSDRRKTLHALQRAWQSFEKILPLLLVVMLIIGLTLAIMSPAQITRLIGNQSGICGLLLAAVIGSVTLIPGFVTFPLAACLLKAGASFAPVTLFVSTSMMVGIATMPVEFQYVGRKAALVRNGLAIICSVLIAAVMWQVLR